jgi:cytidylate kinase
MIERDRRDSERSIAPLEPAPDAIILDNSDLNELQVFEKAVNIISAKNE